MGKVSTKTIQNVSKFFDSLPEEVKDKCALCNETLVHIVKTAEARTGAGTATVTRMLSERINANAAPADVVSGSQLRDRVRIKEGKKLIWDKIPNKESLTQNSIATNHVKNQLDPSPRQEELQPPHIAAISNGHYDTDSNGNNFPIRDPELRKREHEITMIIYPHLFEPIEGLTTCKLNSNELYEIIPSYCMRNLDEIDKAICLLVEIKKLHGKKYEKSNRSHKDDSLQPA